MQKNILYRAGDLSPDQRRAAETLVGHTLDEDDLLTVRTSKGQLLKEARTGQAREDTFDRLFARIDRTARQAAGVPDAEIEVALDEATSYVRHNRE